MDAAFLACLRPTAYSATATAPVTATAPATLTATHTYTAPRYSEFQSRQGSLSSARDLGYSFLDSKGCRSGEGQLSTYFDRPDHIAKMRKKAMQQDFSWDRAAAAYEQLYLEAYQMRRGHPFGRQES